MSTTVYLGVAWRTPNPRELNYMNNKLKHLEANTLGRDFVIGDIHGCFDEVHALLKSVDFNTTIDRLISVGDLIDRGPQSMECIDLVYLDWFHAVRGNHEDLMINSILHDSETSLRCWVSNGGLWYTGYHETELHIAATRLNELPYVITVGDGPNRFNVVHADLARMSGQVALTDKHIDEWNFGTIDEDNMLWGRAVIADAAAYDSRPYHDPEHMSITFVGHTPGRLVKRAHQQVYLDTGGVYHHTNTIKSEQNMLTMACPTDGMVYSYNMVWKTTSSSPIRDVVNVKDIGR